MSKVPFFILIMVIISGTCRVDGRPVPQGDSGFRFDPHAKFAVSLLPAVSSNHSPEVPANAEVVADQTVLLILQFLMERHQSGDALHDLETPVFYLQVNAPPAVRERMVSALLERGVRLAGDAEGFHALRVEWQPDNRLFHQRKNGEVRRQMRSGVVFTWLDPNREIVDSWHSRFDVEDVFDEDLLPESQMPHWHPASFQREETQQGRTWLRRLAEPALITGAVAVTIYLLYNVRS